jgi:hypothetical protein
LYISILVPSSITSLLQDSEKNSHFKELLFLENTFQLTCTFLISKGKTSQAVVFKYNSLLNLPLKTKLISTLFSFQDIRLSPEIFLCETYLSLSFNGFDKKSILEIFFISEASLRDNVSILSFQISSNKDFFNIYSFSDNSKSLFL